MVGLCLPTAFGNTFVGLKGYNTFVGLKGYNTFVELKN